MTSVSDQATAATYHGQVSAISQQPPSIHDQASATSVFSSSFPRKRESRKRFYVLAVSGALGFGWIAGTALSIAKVLFGLFLLGFLVTLLLGVFSGKKIEKKIETKL